MDTKNSGGESSSETGVEIIESRALKLAADAPSSIMEIAELSLAVACDVVRGAMTANNANATSNAISKGLKAIELQLKHGEKNRVHKLLR